MVITITGYKPTENMPLPVRNENEKKEKVLTSVRVSMKAKKSKFEGNTQRNVLPTATASRTYASNTLQGVHKKIWMSFASLV